MRDAVRDEHAREAATLAIGQAEAASVDDHLGHLEKPRIARHSSLDLASFTNATSAARASSGVLTGLANATRTGRGTSRVCADISKPYRSTPVIVAEVISVAFEKA